MTTSHVSKNRLNRLIATCRAKASQVELIFITNLIEGDIREYGESGLSMSSQYYKESDISLIVQTFERIGFSVRPFYNEIDFICWAADLPIRKRNDRWQLVVTTAEGGEGEGRRALIPSFCNLVGLCCWNSPAHGSSVARHKYHANKLLSSCGIRVPETWYYSLERSGWMNNCRPETGQKVIIKPAWESGSKGIDNKSIVVVDNDFSEIVSQRVEAFGQSCVVQEFKTGYEVGVPIIRLPDTLAVGLIGFSDGDDLRYGKRARTFQDEKVKKSARNFLFNHIPRQQAERAMCVAERAFDFLSMNGLGRIDMRIDEDGEGWIFDTNESPPPLRRSSFVQLFGHLGYEYEDVLVIMIGINMMRFGQLSL